MSPRLYTLLDRHRGGTRLRALAAKLMRQHPNPMTPVWQRSALPHCADEKLADQKQIPLHDAIAFLAMAKQASKGRQGDGVAR